MPYKDPARQAQYMRDLRARQKMDRVNKVNVNPDVNPVRKSYVLSYSRKKYQFVLYSVDSEGKKSLVRSYAKGEKVVLGNALIELTWGPDLDIVKEDFQ